MAGPVVEVKFDEAKLARIQRMLRAVPAGMPRVMSRGINRTATAARVSIARRIAARVKIKQSAIKKGISLKKATYRRWIAHLNIYGKRIPLINFGARQLKAGTSYRIAKAGPRKRIQSAFIQTMQSGHRGVFRRYRETTKRLPIVQLYGPSVGAVFEGAGRLAKEVQREAYKKLEKNIDDQVKLALSK